jgi:hypothetical protein
MPNCPLRQIQLGIIEQHAMQLTGSAESSRVRPLCLAGAAPLPEIANAMTGNNFLRDSQVSRVQHSRDSSGAWLRLRQVAVHGKGVCMQRGAQNG